MKRSLKKGLPGGPNEKVFSTDGYRSTSPDVNNPFNIIPSGSITMKEKDGSPLRKGPLMGTDNLGNSQMMFPGADYQFPGNMVTETPLAKKGGPFQNSNIYATNKLFAVNKLFKKRKKGKRARGVYNPKAKYTYQPGGSVDLPEDVGIGYLPDEERSYYNPLIDTVYLNPNASEEEFNHEMAHAWQNRQDGFRSDPYSPKLRPSTAASDEQAATYFNRKGDDVDRYINNLKTIVPELGGHTWNEDLDRFIPDQLKYDKVIDPLMYSDPSTLEGEAEYMSQVYGRPPLGIKKDGGAIEIEIDESDIDKYVKGGYVVEDISVPSLNRMDDGGEKRKKRRNKEKNVEVIDSTEQPITPENIEQVIEKPEVEVNPAQERVPLMMQFSNEFQENNPYDAYYEKAAYDYLKSKKGWNEALGINKSNLPENVAKRIQNNYYKDLEKFVINKSERIKKDYAGKFDKKGNWKPLMGKNNTLNPLSKRPTGHGSWDNYGDGSIQMVYPEQLFMGPGAGILGLAGRTAAKGISNLAKSSLIQGTKAALSQPIANIPGATIGNAIASGFAADAVVNRFPKVPSQIAEGNYSGALENILTGALDITGANMVSPLVKSIGKGIDAGAKLLPEVINYGADVIGTSRNAGKLQLPKYKNVYRAEHSEFDLPAIDNSLTGRWFADKPEEVAFYVRKLKDPNTGEVIMGSDASVRILKKRLPEYKVNQNFGAGMPEEARTMSMGKGDLTDIQLNEFLGPGADRRFKKGVFTQGDLNSMSTAPFLYNPTEGILDPTLVNQLRKNSKLFEGKADAMKYLFEETEKIKNAKPLQSYLPFNKQGGVVSNLTKKEIDKLIKQGYIIEEID